MQLQSRSIASSSDLGQQGSTTSLIWGRKLVIAVAATWFVALCAHISIPLPFTPIPVTMQTFAVLLIGMVLGPIEAAAVLLLYLVEGTIGLPVFSPHGMGGVARLLGMSGGYLLSYPIAALLASTLFSLMKRRFSVFLACSIAALVSDLVILFSGAAWLGVSLRLSLSTALRLGAMPFLAGDLLKIALLATVVAALQRVRKVY